LQAAKHHTLNALQHMQLELVLMLKALLAMRLENSAMLKVMDIAMLERRLSRSLAQTLIYQH